MGSTKNDAATVSNRWGGVAAVLFPVLLLVGWMLAPTPPEATSTPEQVLRYFTTNSDGVLRQTFVAGFLEALLLLLFVGGLWNFLRRAEGETAGLSSVAFASGLAIFPGLVALAATHAGLARVPSDADAGMVWAIWRVSTYADLTTTWIIAVFIGAVTLAALASGAFPRWLLWLGAIACAGQLIMGTDIFLKSAAISQDSMFGLTMLVAFTAWVVAVGVVMLRRTEV
jgi:hypothetical protein